MNSKLVCSDNEEKLLMQRLADDFQIAVKNYRKAKRENEIYDPKFTYWTEEEEEKYYEEERKRRNTINTSEGYIKITRVEYWENVLKSKIEVINAIGGFKFMQDFSYFLREIDIKAGEECLSLESAFCWHAEGIGHWVN